jgi:hypothetical protein
MRTEDKRAWIFFIIVIIVVLLIFYLALRIGFSKLAVEGFNTLIRAFGGTPL